MMIATECIESEILLTPFVSTPDSRRKMLPRVPSFRSSQKFATEKFVDGTPCDRTAATASCESSVSANSMFRDENIDFPPENVCCTSLASALDVETLLEEIQIALRDNEERKQRIRERFEARLDITSEYLNCNSDAKAKVASQRMQRLRIEMGRIASIQCSLMEMYIEIHSEWKNAKAFGSEASFTVDVDIEHYREALVLIEEYGKVIPAIRKTDKELLEDVRELTFDQKQQC